MRGDAYARLRNDHAVSEIHIGVEEFKCIGVSSPHDHWHIYVDMGDEDTIICPRYAASFGVDPRLRLREADPPTVRIQTMAVLGHSASVASSVGGGT